MDVLRSALLAFVTLADQREAELGGLSEEMAKCRDNGRAALDETRQLSAAALLVHAYASAEVDNGSVEWEDVNKAWGLARKELGAERVAEIERLYLEG